MAVLKGCTTTFFYYGGQKGIMGNIWRHSSKLTDHLFNGCVNGIVDAVRGVST